MRGITPFLWFDDQAGEAAEFYTSVFKDSEMGRVARYGDAGPGEPGSVMTASFRLSGIEFTALNGGPIYQFTPAVSFVVNCDDQAEVDYYWERLGEGGEYSQCGWLTDRFGVSWQVVPVALFRFLGDPDPARAKRVTEVMLKQVKLDVAELEAAFNGA